MTDLDALLCLPATTLALVRRVPPEARHAGLLLDRQSLQGDWRTPGKADGSLKRQSLERVAAAVPDAACLREVAERRRRLLEAQGALLLRFRCQSPLALHLSRSATLENTGLCLHPLYGFAFVPGSGLKGLARSWAETVWQPLQPDPEAALGRIRRLFGTAESDAAAAGTVVFHDGLPLAWPALELGIANVHHPQYYTGDGALPGDWESPLPNIFLQVSAGSRFEMALGLRRGADEADRSQARDWLQQALAWAGAGAKTSSGLGRMLPEEGPPPPDLRPAEATGTRLLELTTPAFLAGAQQGAADCDLTGTTLRGLLRWWWRSLHADALCARDLKELEGLVWGDTRQGIGVTLRIEPEKDLGVFDFAEAKGGSRESPLLSQNRIREPGNRRTTLGLYYSAYGMADGQNRRFYRPEGSRWRIELAARAHLFRKGEAGETRVPGDRLLQQALDALWLFCRFGGAGSKARKGFGSFADIEVEGVGSRDDVLSRARAFRKAVLGVDGSETPMPPGRVSALAAAEVLEVPTRWTNRWDALDRVGQALQQQAKDLKGPDRAVLGLPRRVGPSPLRGEHGDRHAAPLHLHLAGDGQGRLLVRIVAFPVTAMLPRNSGETDRQAAVERLNDVALGLADCLEGQAKTGSDEAKTRHPPAARARAASAGSSAGDRLEKGAEVEVRLAIDKKGRWTGTLLRAGLTGKTEAVLVGEGRKPYGKAASPPADWSEGGTATVRLLTVGQTDDGEILSLELEYLTPEERARQAAKPGKGSKRRR